MKRVRGLELCQKLTTDSILGWITSVHIHFEVVKWWILYVQGIDEFLSFAEQWTLRKKRSESIRTALGHTSRPQLGLVLCSIGKFASFCTYTEVGECDYVVIERMVMKEEQTCY